MTERKSLFPSLRWRWHRIRGGWRCKVGVHRWRGHMDCGDGVNVRPWNPHHPWPGAWRVCTWCGLSHVVYYGWARGFYWARRAKWTLG